MHSGQVRLWYEDPEHELVTGFGVSNPQNFGFPEVNPKKLITVVSIGGPAMVAIDGTAASATHGQYCPQNVPIQLYISAVKPITPGGTDTISVFGLAGTTDVSITGWM